MTVSNATAKRVMASDDARLARRLLQAQEEERARLARELHDDISQRLALLAIEVVQLSEMLPASAIEARAFAATVRQDIAQLGSDVQALSHRLHASALEVYGLVNATERLCRQLRARHQVRIEFVARDVPAVLDSIVALNLFRILQEAIANAFKHSGAGALSVMLHGTPQHLRLTVADDGRGFDVSRAKAGLGMITMRERVGLVGGELSLESRPGEGTRLTASVPMSAAMTSPSH